MASKPIDDDDLILYILGGLGPEYGPFVTSITARDKHVRLSDLHGLLLSEEIRVSDIALEQHNISVNVATKTSNTSTYGKSKSRGCGRHNKTTVDEVAINLIIVALQIYKISSIKGPIELPATSIIEWVTQLFNVIINLIMPL
ncbi:hypothetical protein MRB53_034536 [Persea americana]|uniref:Uncharacterized protein n=1 Tax=Persea americana TaxID=3435 RepID=A0ACC2K2C9_PERAE|nr:hypothetical protein MRB53_034536 [Persea americana]